MYFMQSQRLWICKDTAKVFSLSYVRNNYLINIFSPCEEDDTNAVDKNSNK